MNEQGSMREITFLVAKRGVGAGREGDYIGLVRTSH
jgi:hypothetical protein